MSRSTNTAPAVLPITGRACGSTDTRSGEPCRTKLGLCEECGECFAHCEHRAQERHAARSKGGKAAAAKRAAAADMGFDESDALPRPETLKDCAFWLSKLAWGVSVGRISSDRADKARLAVKDLRDLLLRDQEDRIDEMRKLIDRLKRDRKGGR